MLKIMNDFSSIDRLIEFGLSIAVAQQMMNTVNTCIHQMTIPGTGNSMPVPNYYVVIEGKQVGPLSHHALQDMIRQEKVKPDTLLWRQGMSAWKLLKEVSEL